MQVPRDSFSAPSTNLFTNLELKNFAFYSLVKLFKSANMIYLILDQHLGTAIVAVDMEVWTLLRSQMRSKLILLKLVFNCDIPLFGPAFERTSQFDFGTVFGYMVYVRLIIHVSVRKLASTILAAPELHLPQLIQNDPRNLSFMVRLLAHGARYSSK